MVKRLIFDLDNTLIMWKSSYKNALRSAIKKHQIVSDDVLLDIVVDNYDSLIENYENYYNYYSKENMLELINSRFHLNLNISFIEDWLSELNDMADVDNDVIDTLDYLSKKYELVILTNWFSSSQLARMKKVGIDKYFKEVYSGEKYIKPSLQSFKVAIGDKDISECIMIGDDYKIDIEGAINAGLDAIMVTSKDIDSTDMYKVIHNIKELKEML